MKFILYAILLLVIVVSAYKVIGQQKPPISNTQSNSANTQQSRTVFIDPETGKMTSEPSETDMQQVQQSQQRVGTDTNELPIRHLEDGSMMVDLDEHFNKSLEATVDKQGDINIEHKE